MDVLRKFNNDVATKDEFKAFVMSVINQEALEKMYKGENVSHIKDAKELLDKAFVTLEKLYEPTVQAEEPTNHAR